LVPAQQYDPKALSGLPFEVTGGVAPTATPAYCSAMIGTAPVLGQAWHCRSKAMCRVYFVGTGIVTDPVDVSGANFSHTGEMVVLWAPRRPPGQLATPARRTVTFVVPGAIDGDGLAEGDALVEGDGLGEVDVELDDGVGEDGAEVGLPVGEDVDGAGVLGDDVSPDVVHAVSASIANAAHAAERIERIVHPLDTGSAHGGRTVPRTFELTPDSLAQLGRGAPRGAPPDG